MTKSNFSEEDKEKLVEFLNMVATKAKFEIDTKEVIQYFKLLSYMQQTILPKINSHILEVIAVHESTTQSESSEGGEE